MLSVEHCYKYLTRFRTLLFTPLLSKSDYHQFKCKAVFCFLFFFFFFLWVFLLVNFLTISQEHSLKLSGPVSSLLNLKLPALGAWYRWSSLPEVGFIMQPRLNLVKITQYLSLLLLCITLLVLLIFIWSISLNKYQFYHLNENDGEHQLRIS